MLHVPVLRLASRAGARTWLTRRISSPAHMFMEISLLCIEKYYKYLAFLFFVMKAAVVVSGKIRLLLLF